MKHARVGYQEQVGAFRAPASTDPEQDQSPMIQELIARTKFIATKIDLNGKSILDYGCGTGVALQWIRSHHHLKRLVGLDISRGAIESAKAHYPGIEFQVMDIETPSKALLNEFDVSLCLEVLEHLQRPDKALSHVANHYMKSGGILVATTPNRMVFSDGMEPSPINKTHIHEMDVDEFTDLLKTYFNKVNVYGMRFKDSDRMKTHKVMVEHARDGYKLFGELWWNKWISRFYRWIMRCEILYVLTGKRHNRWKASDFEFVDGPLEIRNAIWFLAIASN